jgi:hypothetical protein
MKIKPHLILTLPLLLCLTAIGPNAKAVSPPPDGGYAGGDTAEGQNALLGLSEGKPYSVRYDQVNAMLLNEFLKEHHKVQEQEVTIAELRSTVAQQEKAFQSKLAEQQKRNRSPGIGSCEGERTD